MKTTNLKTAAVAALFGTGLLAGCTDSATNQKTSDNMKTLNLTQEWDKTFPQSDKVNHGKVTFTNRYGIMLAADMYVPKDASGKLPAIAVCGPFGAVKEQASGLYAQALAERGFLTIAFDPSYTGESGGEPRYVVSPDINTEDFSAAVDFLATHHKVDPEQIGVIGICGWGGLAINAAAADPRIKATVASTMYDMSRVSANGYFDADDSAEARNALRKTLAAQRTEDFRNGFPKPGGGVPDELPADAPQFFKDYHAYYKTPRGYHKRSLNSNQGRNATEAIPFINFPLMSRADEIENAVLVIHGEKAHSRYFSEDAFKKLKGDNKELMIVPGANHTDLYDNLDMIPFDKIDMFFKKYLGKCLNLDKQPGMCAKEPMTADGIVRLSKIEVYPQHLEEYMKYATEVGEVSLRTEPGVLTMYAVSEKENPCKVTILETYASRESYEKHIASEHFRKYKQGTLHMVKSLVLADQTPLNPENRINNFIQ